MGAAGADLEALEARAREEISAATTLQGLTEVRARALGKKGSLSEVLRGLGRLPAEERGPAGQAANAAKQRLERSRKYLENSVGGKMAEHIRKSSGSGGASSDGS